MFERIKKSNEITALKSFEERLRMFDELRTLSEETKKIIRPYISNYQKEYVSFVTRTLNFSRIYILFGIPIAIAFALSPLFVVYALFPQVFMHNNFLGSFFMAVNFFLIAVILSNARSLTTSILEKMIENRFILLYITTIIIEFVYSMEINPDVWVGIEHKRMQLRRLEKLARYIEIYLPRKLRSGDSVTDDWFKDRTKEVAAALRGKKRWILTPTKYTRDDLLRRLATTLVCILEGDWDALERLELNDLIRLPFWLSFLTSLWKFLKLSLGAGSLFGFFVLLQHFTGILPETVYVPAVTLSILLGVSIILAASNPNLNDRVSNVKDIGGLLPFLGAGSKL